jgi:hypothetical protein
MIRIARDDDDWQCNHPNCQDLGDDTFGEYLHTHTHTELIHCVISKEQLWEFLAWSGVIHEAY